MEHPFLWFVKLFEMIGLSHFAHAYPHVIYSWVVMIFLIIVFTIGTKGLSMIPTKGQNLLEVVISGMEDFMIDITGEEGRRQFPIIATVFIYILTCNLMGLVPGFFPPTANLNTTLSCALVVVFWTHVIGIQHHGAGYIKHFMGPMLAMAPLIFIIEVIGHTARLLSLSFRLFGNMVGHEIVLGILFMLAGLFFAPLPIMALGIFVSFIQAFVFFLLSIIYFTGSIEHAH